MENWFARGAMAGAWRSQTDRPRTGAARRRLRYGPSSSTRYHRNPARAIHAGGVREARLRSILETAPDAIVTIDEKGIILSFRSNAAEKLFGYASGDVIGRNIKMLMPQPHQDMHDSYVSRYLLTGEKHIIGIGRQVEAQRKDGTIFPMELAVGEVKLAGSHIFTGFIRDQTARIKLEQDPAKLRRWKPLASSPAVSPMISTIF